MKKLASCIIVILVLSLASVAQDRTMFFMNRVPQSSTLNPSVIPEFSTYVGIPLLSGVSLSYNNSSFAFKNVLKNGTGLQKDSLFFDVDGFESKLKRINFVRTEANFDFVSFGLAIKGFYGSFNISSRTSASFDYPRSIIDLKKGNYDPVTNMPRTINLNDMYANGFSYVEVGFGLAKVLNERLSVGARMKVLNGIAAVKTSFFKANIVTSDDFQRSTINVNAGMYVSAPRLVFDYDSEGKIDNVRFGDSKDNSSNGYRFGSNLGLGLDLGATYKFDDKFTFYGSVNDLGFIRWNRNGYRLLSKGAYEFNGADITPDADGNVDFDKAMEAIADTLKTKFKPTDDDAKFTTTLNTKINLGATYKALDWLTCGALLRGGFYGTYFDPSLTLSFSSSPYKWLSGTLTYSIYNRSYSNFGVGVVLGTKPVQFYLAADNIVFRTARFRSGSSSFTMPAYSRSMSILFGVNILLGRRMTDDAGKVEMTD